ncbi:NACHT domain-containing protein [Streptomyces sp. NPDC101115]|uniref:NACHT domain-containing protein n=1 Tax=Streptomyces sp. NPDC101115 TaxID=3366106 RepID=UPI00381CA2F5
MRTSQFVFAVLGKRQGTGVLLPGNLILTAAHVIGGAHSATVAGMHREPQRLRVVWSDERLDAALLLSERRLGPTPQLSTVATDRPIPGCMILGFPHIQRDEERRPDLDQFTGTVLPMAGLLRHTLTVELDRPPATEATDGPSPLAGLSGAPVYADDGLLGIVRSVPRGRGHRRLECLPLTALLADNEAYRWLPDDFAPPRPVTATHPHDQPYEEEYAEAVGAAYRRTRIFGLDELGKRASEWDLDTAYLSLEAAPRDRETVPVPRRIDDLLADRPRVLLRGDAGAGKTTLVWWLASHAAAGTLGPELAKLNGLVPFVVPLRSLRTRGGGFPSPAELPGVAGLVIDAAPDGWAGRVLAAGRALLLVDGLDEVTQDDRDDAHTWLSGLLARYPDTRCVATVRPHAVAPDWLGAERFEELTLLPLRGEDIQAFVTAWHDAARLDAGPDENLADLEHDLAQQFRHNPNLAELARTPLLCAVICALHRLREGFLPETRWELYDSALTMLLGARDERRRVGTPDGIRMSVEEHRQLLQRLAARLVRAGGQTEFTREQALQRLEHDLPSMPRVRAQGTPEEIFTHLINRSGLLQERTDDVFQFAHRTFQDFLAAKEFVEDDSLHEPLHRAYDQQWHDVLLLSAGHCTRRDLPVLVEGLLKAGSDTRRRDLKTTLYVLAALAAQHAAWLDEALHRRVRKAVKSMIPPRNREQISQLARLGDYVLPLIPDPREVTGEAAGMCVDLIGEIGGSAALPTAEAYASVDHGRIARFWNRFPTEAFARNVLSRMPSNAVIGASTAEQLRHVRRVASIHSLIVTGSHAPEALVSALAGRKPAALSLLDNPLLADLDLLRSVDCSRLETVVVEECPGLRGVSALAGLPALTRFQLLNVPADATLDLRPLIETQVRITVSGIPRKNVLGAGVLGDRLAVR